MTNTNDNAYPIGQLMNNYISVRLIKDTAAPPSPLIDRDGNIYTSVIIGSQEWIVENLRVTHYNDGTLIPNVQDRLTWLGLVTGAYCYYDNDEATYKETYGAFYNWYACNTGKLAYFTKGGVEDVGWRVPVDADFDTLAANIGGYPTGGGKLKEAGLEHWEAPNTGATDEYGFKFLPYGQRNCGGGVGADFVFLGYVGALQSLTESAFPGEANQLVTVWNNVTASIVPDYKWVGFPVRCVKDV